MKPRAKDCRCQRYDGEVTREDGLMHLVICERLDWFDKAVAFWKAEEESWVAERARLMAEITRLQASALSNSHATEED